MLVAGSLDCSSGHASKETGIDFGIRVDLVVACPTDDIDGCIALYGSICNGCRHHGLLELHLGID